MLTHFHKLDPALGIYNGAINIELYRIYLLSDTAKSLYIQLRISMRSHLLTEWQKERISELFFENQKAKWVVYKFYNRLRMKILRRKDRCWNDQTTYLTPIKDISEESTVKLYSNGKYWSFHYDELRKSMNYALQSSSYMIATPVAPKNPWSGEELNIGQITSIYEKITSNGGKFTIFLSYFRDCNFDIETMKSKYHTQLCENAIRTEIYDISEEKLLEYAYEELLSESQNMGWDTCMKGFPRFDTICVKCLTEWLSNQDNVEMIQGSMFRKLKSTNLKNTQNNYTMIKDLKIDDRSSDYARLWLKKHRGHSRKIVTARRRLDRAEYITPIEVPIPEFMRRGTGSHNHGRRPPQVPTLQLSAINYRRVQDLDATDGGALLRSYDMRRLTELLTSHRGGTTGLMGEDSQTNVLSTIQDIEETMSLFLSNTRNPISIRISTRNSTNDTSSTRGRRRHHFDYRRISRRRTFD